MLSSTRKRVRVDSQPEGVSKEAKKNDHNACDQIKYSKLVSRLKPCKMKSEGAWKSIKEGNRKDHANSSSRMKLSSVRALTVSVVSLFHEIENLTEKASLLRRRRKLQWRNLKSCPRRSRFAEVSKIPPLASQGDRGIYCRPR